MPARRREPPGPGEAARFSEPAGITTDGTSLYVADSGSNTIRKIAIATATVTTLAGTAGSYGRSDGTGSLAEFFSPQGVVADGSSLSVGDSDNHTIRAVR